MVVAIAALYLIGLLAFEILNKAETNTSSVKFWFSQRSEIWHLKIKICARLNYASFSREFAFFMQHAPRSP